jgi:GT2 family glycosyltransferase
LSASNERKQPKVSIIILNWNGVGDTIECVESLKRITYPNYEVVIVDNGSEGNDVQVLHDRFGSYVHIIKNDMNYGFAEGNNIGIRYALKRDVEYVLLLNNDTIVAPDFLSQLIKVAESDLRIGLVGPKVYFYHEPNRIWFAGAKISLLAASSTRGLGQVDNGQFDKVDCVDVITGSCMLIKRRVLESIGLLDPIYFFSSEDVDLSLRSIQAGFSNVFVPNSKIWHKSNASGSRHTHLLYYVSRNQIILVRKYWRVFKRASIRWIMVVIVQLVTSLIRYRDMKSFLLRAEGLRDALRVNIESSKFRPSA